MNTLQEPSGKYSAARIIGFLTFILAAFVIVWNTILPSEIGYNEAGVIISRSSIYPEVIILQLLSFIATIYGLNKFTTK